MPEIGEIKKGREIPEYSNNKSCHSYAWLACPDCGIERWVLLRKGSPAFHRCSSCNGKVKRGIPAMGQGRPPKIYQLVQGVPLVGDLRLGREIGRGDCMQYKYIECPGCGKRRWVSIHRIITTSGRCTHCRLMQKAEKSNNWRGGAFVSPTGYKWVRIYPNDPFYHMVNNRGYVLEHRLVKARHIGRPLLDEEVVHHINENKLDNRIENLMLLPNDSEHHKIKHHHVAPGIQAAAAERFDELVKRD